MSHSELCPVCKGSGKIIKDNPSTTSNIPSTEICHGCNGLGWVTVQDNNQQMFPVPYYPLPYYPWAPWEPSYKITCKTT